MTRAPRKPRSIRVEDVLWLAALEAADERGEVLSEVIRAYLLAYVKPKRGKA